jgi:hypothetical protein
MFEKEAEEYANKEYEMSSFVDHYGIADAFQEGAEFGYNKAKEEVEDSYRESLCNSELNLASVTEQLEELEKENEWHYPSKGEFPKCDEKTQLIFYVTCYYGDITRKRMVLGYYQKSFMNDDVKLFVEKSKGYEEDHLPKDVIAWKEIALPELLENGEIKY